MVGKLVQQQYKPEPNASKNNGDSTGEINNGWSSVGPTNHSYSRKGTKLWQLSYIPLCVILILLFLVVLLPLLDRVDLRTQYLLNKNFAPCQDTNCSFEIVESIPESLVYNSSIKHKSTFEAWKKLIQIAEHKIEIASFYWTMRQWPEFPNESKQGDEIFNDLLNAGLKRNITINIVQNKPSRSMPDNETQYLIQKKAASVKTLDFNRLLGAGVLHTKFWIIDRKHLYIGSANMDWRALTQVKELGIVFYNCSCVAEDLAKIFEVYWLLGNVTSLPNKWPDSLSTIYNSKNPYNLVSGNQKTLLYISSSPPQFSPKGRNEDIDALLEIIRNAKKFIHISVMDYIPMMVYGRNEKYWSVIDDALRTALVNKKVAIRLMTSKWSNTRPAELFFLRSLFALNNYTNNAVFHVKFFQFPKNLNQTNIPYSRVNHNKYMVTDNGAFIGTSNWSGDYFTNTAGVSLVSPSINGTPNAIQQQLKDIFDRDWNSSYARHLNL